MLLLINGSVLNSNFSWFLALSVSFNGRVGRKSTGFPASVELSIPLKLGSSAWFSRQPFPFPGFPPRPTVGVSTCLAGGPSVGTPVEASLPGTAGPWWGRWSLEKNIN